MSLNKKKSRIISFRVSEDEYEVIAGTASSANLNITSYLKARALGGKIQRPLMKSEDIQSMLPPLSKLSGEVGRVGNNLNQSKRALKMIARDCYMDKIERTELERLTKEFSELKHEFQTFQDEVHDIWRRLR